MKNLFLTFSLLMLILGFHSHGIAQDSSQPSQNGEVKYLTILIEKDNQGKYIVNLVDAKGVKEPLSLGSYSNKLAVLQPATPNEVMEQVKFNQVPEFTPVKIMLEKSTNGQLNSVVITSTGKKEALTFGTLLTSLVKAVKYTSKNPISKPLAEKTSVEVKEQNGIFEPYIVDAQGNREVLNLGTILKDLTLELTGIQQ